MVIVSCILVIKNMEVLQPSQKAFSKAFKTIKDGGVVICPTDTVYGFLADALNKKAVEKIYKIKKRPKSKPLPIFVSSIKMAKELAEIDERQMKYLKKYWPGKYTFVLKVNKVSKVYKVNETIALRIPKHPFLQKLLKKVNRPLVQTSVNLAGQEPLKTAEQIMATPLSGVKGALSVPTFGKSKLVGLLVTSSKPLRGKSSKIIDLTGKKLTVLR